MAPANPYLNFAGKYMGASPSTGLGSVFGGEYANVSLFSDMPVEATADVLREAPEGIMAGLTLEFLSARG
jgi:hypothetical protein